MKTNRGQLEGFDIAIVIVAAIGAVYFLYKYPPINDFLRNLFSSSATSKAVHSASSIFDTLLVILALFFMTLIAYCAVRLLEIRKKEHEYHHHGIHEYAHRQHEREEKMKEKVAVSRNPRWVQVIEYMSSDKQGDWKLAIIEADSILEDLLDSLGFTGEGIGEKLRSADQDKFPRLPQAWEVHAIRNRIAHEGSNFELSPPEAKRTIATYEQIFRDYGFI